MKNKDESLDGAKPGESRWRDLTPAGAAALLKEIDAPGELIASALFGEARPLAILAIIHPRANLGDLKTFATTCVDPFLLSLAFEAIEERMGTNTDDALRARAS